MLQVVEVGGELQDHWEARGGHRASEDLFDDRTEVKVHVVAGDIELHSGELTGLRAAVHRLHERRELIGAEAAEREDAVLLAGAREVLIEVALNPNVRPAERIEPTPVGLLECAAIEAEEFWKTRETPRLTQGEVPLTRLLSHGTHGDGAEAA